MPSRNAATEAAANFGVPAPKPKKSGGFRRLVTYTLVGGALFYPVSAYASTKNETYRELFTKLPGGEALADYADEHGWDRFGVGTITNAAVRLTHSTDDMGAKLEEAKKAAEAKAAELTASAKASAAEAQKRASAAAVSAKAKAAELTKEAEAKAAEVVDKVEKAAHITHAKADKAVAAASDKTEKVVAAVQTKAAAVADKAAAVGDKADKVVEKYVNKDAKAVEEVVNAYATVNYPDLAKPRALRPETVQPQKPSFEGKEQYNESLPLGFEAPPGYYVKPPAPKKKVPEGEPLPLLVPQVKEIAAAEPVIAQLATTIDSLTTSLSKGKGGPSADAADILSRAQGDLAALNQRIDDVKKAEKERLEKAVAKQQAEFETALKQKQNEWEKDEAGLKETWETERQKMVDGWREVLNGELETQRQIIEQRLKEEVVSQGIELQRRWLRSIKSQVETERGGRLAKLDTLNTSLKQLERITLDNSAVLDDNVRLHKIWSALRAVQTKAENGDVSFDDELRALQSLASATDGPNASDNAVIRAALGQLESSGIPQTGVKSFASLSSWFTTSVAPRIHEASLVPAPEDAGVGSHIASTVLSKLLFRPKAGLADGADVGSVLARAEWALSEKDLDSAAREVNTLTGWPRKLADDWLREARRKLEVQQALEIVGAEATLSSLLMV